MLLKHKIANTLSDARKERRPPSPVAEFYRVYPRENIEQSERDTPSEIYIYFPLCEYIYIYIYIFTQGVKRRRTPAVVRTHPIFTWPNHWIFSPGNTFGVQRNARRRGVIRRIQCIQGVADQQALRLRYTQIDRGKSELTNVRRRRLFLIKDQLKRWRCSTIRSAFRSRCRVEVSEDLERLFQN